MTDDMVSTHAIYIYMYIIYGRVYTVEYDE